MAENRKTNEEITENEINGTEAVSDGPVHEPKQNYIIYTVISVLLFAVLYSCWKFVVPKLFRDYTFSVSGGSLTAEQLEIVKRYTEIDCENISEAVFQRTRRITAQEVRMRRAVSTGTSNPVDTEFSHVVNAW